MHSASPLPLLAAPGHCGRDAAGLYPRALPAWLPSAPPDSVHVPRARRAVIKASLLLMLVLTVLIRMAMRWREERRPAPLAPAAKPARGRAPRRPGLVARTRAGLDRWITAAALAALLSIALTGGIQWLRILTGA